MYMLVSPRKSSSNRSKWWKLSRKVTYTSVSTKAVSWVRGGPSATPPAAVTATATATAATVRGRHRDAIALPATGLQQARVMLLPGTVVVFDGYRLAVTLPAGLPACCQAAG